MLDIFDIMYSEALKNDKKYKEIYVTDKSRLLKEIFVGVDNPWMCDIEYYGSPRTVELWLKTRVNLEDVGICNKGIITPISIIKENINDEDKCEDDDGEFVYNYHMIYFSYNLARDIVNMLYPVKI